MRTTRFLFLMIIWAALPHGTSYAAPPQQTAAASAASTASDHAQGNPHAAPADGGKHQKDRNPSDRQRNHRQVSGRNHARSPATKTRDRRKLSNNREHLPSGNAMDLHPTASGKSVDAAKGGPPQGKTVNNASRVRRPSVVGPSASVLNNARHRGANPAVIGGSAMSDKNTGTINGNRVHRKP